jgi:hypothetical protein
MFLFLYYLGPEVGMDVEFHGRSMDGMAWTWTDGPWKTSKISNIGRIKLLYIMLNRYTSDYIWIPLMICA